jgi:branched-chain amino acid transport system ATP-binding protein
VSPILQIDDLTLRFGGLTVLSDVSLTVAEGELLALIGPNGAGKTSIFNCISGVYRGTGGIALRGKSLIGLAPHAIAQLGVARTFQHGELVPEMSVMDNLLAGRHCRIGTNFFAEMLSLPSVRRAEAAHRQAIEEILALVELSEFAGMQVGSLPLGLQKVLGFARALALQPAVLLLDEPSAGLSRPEREHLARAVLTVQHKLKLAIIWIEHDLQMVADLADRIHVINAGRTLAVGDPDAVLNHPDVIAAYVGHA